jgi:hypothetical protein
MKIKNRILFVSALLMMLAHSAETMAFTFANEANIPVSVTLQNVMPEVNKAIIKCSVYRKEIMVGTGVESIPIGKQFSGMKSKQITVKVLPVKGQQMYNPTKYSCALKLQDASGEHDPIISGQSVSGKQEHLHAADNKPFKTYIEKPL